MRTDVRRLRRDAFRAGRFAGGRAVLLFLTDRCPVGCGHCSVDSRRDSPRITDFELLERLVSGLSDDDRIAMVGISGGEPFIERRSLSLVVEKLAEADKDIVLYTSGVWARHGSPGWVEPVLRQAACVVLSTDAFHARQLDTAHFVEAARAIASAGAPVVVQVLDIASHVSEAQGLLSQAFGAEWERLAEISLTQPLPYGRGGSVFARPPLQLAESVRGGCELLAAPVVRYDGRIVACCNEEMIVGRGPGRMQRQCASGGELRQALDDIRSDPLLAAIGSVGAGAVAMTPGYDDLATTQVHGRCDLCWRLQERTDEPMGGLHNRVLELLPAMVGRPQ